MQDPYRGRTTPLRFRYQTYEFGNEDIHLRSLRDVQQYSDPLGKALDLGISPANWALFGVVWDSSRVLANLMAVHEIEGKRILEVGCGMALSSLLINRRGGNITATDYHPEAASFLKANTQLNDDVDIPFFLADWNEESSTHGQFDLIIGSDILYERTNTIVLVHFIQQHAHRDCEVILVDPGRKQLGEFTRRMTDNGFTVKRETPEDSSYLSKPFIGSIMTCTRH